MSRTRFLALSLILDALFINAGIVVAYLIRFTGQLPERNFAPYLALAPVLTLAYLVAAWIYGLYELERSESVWAVVQSVFQAVTLGAVMIAAISFFTNLFAFSRSAILLAWVLQFAMLVGWRLAAVRLTPIRWPEQRVLVVGTGTLGIELAEELEKRSKWGYRVVGLLARDESVGAAAVGDDRYAVLGGLHDLGRVVEAERVDRVIITSPVAVREVVEEVALSEETDVRIDVIPELYEIFIGNVDSIVSDIPLMALTKRPTPDWFVKVKRLLDIALATVLLMIASPVLLAAAAAILVTMGAPVLFSQERVGKDRRHFRVVKLRTMVRGAEAASGPVLAIADDARVTRVGRLLRKYRIDELPQLINILSGDMSFVGPRPERPYFVERFVREIPGYRERFKVKPGVTGLAQVSGSYATTPERKLKYDLIYMYHQNLLMDVQILVETLRVVLTGRGAR